MPNPNIAIVWDFDNTLTPLDSTTKTVEILQGHGTGGEFWRFVKSLRGDTKMPKWEHVLASDAPIWMYSLSRMAARKKVPLNAEFFREFVLPHIGLYENVIPFLEALKALERQPAFQELGVGIHHFVVSAGLKELVAQIFPEDLITWTFGCCYTVIMSPLHPDEPESVPVFCMDETMKTRSLFEIAKGSFNDPKKKVNTRIDDSEYWAPFKNIIYIGDGPTDVPALSLVRAKGGVGIAVFDREKSNEEVNRRLKDMRLDKRADLITPADFSLDSELFVYIKTRCIQIRQRYEAERHVP